MNIDAEIEAAEASWKDNGTITIPNVVLDEAPLTDLLVKAHNIFAGQSFENLDALVCRAVSICPQGVTEENFNASEPLSQACKKFFTNVEKLRKGLKRPALDWGEAVDAAAKDTVADGKKAIGYIIDGVKAIKDKRKAEKEAKEAAELKAIEDAARAKLEADRAEADAKRAAELEGLNAELNARLERERAEQAEKDRLAAEALQAKQSEMERIERELAEFRRAKAAEDKAEADRLAAEAAKREQEAKARAEAARMEEMRPDIEIVQQYGKDVATFASQRELIKIKSQEAMQVMSWAFERLHDIADKLKAFGTTEK